MWGVAAGAAATALLVWRMEPGRDAGQLVICGLWLIIVQASTLLSLIDVAVHRLPIVLVAVTAALVEVGVATGAWLEHRPHWLLDCGLAGCALSGMYLFVARRCRR